MLPAAATIPMRHHVHQAHGLAVAPCVRSFQIAAWAMRRAATQPIPFTSAPADVEAARKAYFDVPTGDFWAFNVAWWSDPGDAGPLSGIRQAFFRRAAAGWENDLALISQPLDFYAQNIYNGRFFRAADNAKGYEEVPGSIGEPRTAIGWTIRPDALYWGPKFLYERYQTPFIISENGMSAHDAVSLDGHVHDPNREDYMRRYLLAYRRAAEDGVDAAGYFAWSLMDNYEWAYGYSERFGLIHVDYATQKRTPKDPPSGIKP